MGSRNLAVLLVLAAAARAQDALTIKGRLLDAEGRPVRGAAVSALWLEGRPTDGAASDADGRFELTARGRSVAVLAIHEGKGLGVVSRFSPKSAGKERELTMGKLVKVHGRFFSSDLGEAPSWTNVYVNVMPGRIRVARHSSEQASFSFLLPPGDYQLTMYGSDVNQVVKAQEIDGDEGEIDLGTIDLEATNIAKLFGKPAPEWTVTGARGLKQDVKIEDLRGKYVILEFWGFW